MAKRSRRARSSSKGASRSDGASWKKSKGLAYLLVGILVCFWFYMLFLRGGGSGDAPRIPQAYMCNVCKEISVYDEHPGGMPPYECKSCHEMAAYEAYVCNNPSCAEKNGGKPPVFPHVVKLPEGVTPPAEDEEPSPEYMEAMMEMEMQFPTCPICGESTPNIERYMTDEAKKMLEELRKKYEEKRKNQ